MISLIYDQPDCQSWLQRLLCNTLTGAGWVGWLSMWSPSPGSLAIAREIAPHAFQSALWPGESFLAPLASHAILVTVCAALFLAWALWQGWSHRDSGQEWYVPAMDTETLARSIGLRQQDLAAWQTARRMVVTHDESLGWIHHVEVLPA